MSIKANPTNYPPGFERNILDKYDSPTYHLKMYMVSDKNIYASSFSPDEKVLIAESGVTSKISISDLTLTTYASPNSKYRSTTHQKISFVLKEFYGARLIDDLYIASQKLKISNYYRAPIILEISFYGQDSTGKTVAISEIDTKIIPMIIVDMSAEIKSSGTIYDVEAYALQNSSSYDEHDIVAQGTTIKDVTTFGEFAKKLEERLNKYAIDQKAFSTSIPNQFEIIVDDTFINFKMDDEIGITKNSDGEELNVKGITDPKPLYGKMSGIEVKHRESPGLTKEKSKKKTYSINQKEKVSDIIEKYLSSCPDYQKLISNKSETDNKDSDEPNSIKTLHRVVTDVKIIGYDNLSGTYSKKYIFKIVPYKHASLLTSGVEENKIDPQALYNSIKGDMVKKYYTYIFTGLNDQIISLDLKFNGAWKIYAPVNTGVESRSESFGDSSGTIVENKSKTYDHYENTSDGFAVTPSTLFFGDTTGTMSGRFTNAYSFSPSDNYRYNVVSNRGSGPALANALLEQSFKGYNDNLTNATITIKGDPFWLGKTNTDELDDFDTKEIYLVLKLQQPKIPDERSGFTEQTTSGFSGLYYVSVIESNFSGGKFTQTLTAHLNLSMPLSEIEL